jgi:Protein of unknown function (DUF1353)
MSRATEFSGWSKCSDGRWILHEPLEWNIGREGSVWVLTVPVGFSFDSSVPRWLRWIVSANHAPWLLAACVHDRLLQEGFDKAFAAGEWWRAARAMRAKDPKAWLVLPAYYGVVLWTVR